MTAQCRFSNPCNLVSLAVIMAVLHVVREISIAIFCFLDLFLAIMNTELLRPIKKSSCVSYQHTCFQKSLKEERKS